MLLNIPQLLDVVRRNGAEPRIDWIMVAAALAESGGETDAVGDHGLSIGLWQLHANGAGHGMSDAARRDPDQACQRMLPEFRGAFALWEHDVASRDELALRTYLWAERPFDFKNLASAGAMNFTRKWENVTHHVDPPPPFVWDGGQITMASLAAANPNIISQRATWGALREANGDDPNDWAAFRQFQIDIFAPDPGPIEPIDFRMDVVPGLKMAQLAVDNPNIHTQRATWGMLRRANGQDPNDWEAFRQFQRDIGAPDPGPAVPVDFPM